MRKEDAERYIKDNMCKDCRVFLGGGKCSPDCKVMEAIKALGCNCNLDKTLDNMSKDIKEIRDEYERVNNPLGDRWEYTNPHDESLAIINKYISEIRIRALGGI